MLASVAAPTVAWAEENAVNTFLSGKYGWTLGVKQESKLLGWSWNLVCDPDRAALPENGKNIFRNWVCRQKDRSYWTIVIWRLPNVSSAAVEKAIYNDMSNGLGYGKVECSSQKTDKGVIRDCAVPLQHGTFYASFYHFEVKVASSYTVEVNGKITTSDILAFTIVVQNAGNSDARVREKLLELVKSIKFTE